MSKKSVYKATEQGWQYCSYCKQDTWHTPKLGLVASNKRLCTRCNTSNELKQNKEMKDPVVQQVIHKFQNRSEVGIKKYGTTLHENNTDDFLNHLQEELMDAILYIQKLKNLNGGL